MGYIWEYIHTHDEETLIWSTKLCIEPRFELPISIVSERNATSCSSHSVDQLFGMWSSSETVSVSVGDNSGFFVILIEYWDSTQPNQLKQRLLLSPRETACVAHTHLYDYNNTLILYISRELYIIHSGSIVYAGYVGLCTVFITWTVWAIHPGNVGSFLNVLHEHDVM